MFTFQDLLFFCYIFQYFFRIMQTHISINLKPTVLSPDHALEPTHGAILNQIYQEPQPKDLDSETLGCRSATLFF